MSRPRLSWVSIPALSATSCVTSNKTLNISEPLCARLLMGSQQDLACRAAAGSTGFITGWAVIPEQARRHKNMKMN